MLLNFLALAAILHLMTGRTASAQESWSALENRNTMISHIEVRVLPVFNLQNPKEKYLRARE